MSSRDKRREKLREKWASHDPNLRAELDRQKQQAQTAGSQPPGTPQITPVDEAKLMQDQAAELTRREQEEAKKKQPGFEEEAMRDVTTDVPGMSPKQRQSMIETANKQIGGQLENYSRMLASSQGMRGAYGAKGQGALNQGAMQAQNQFLRDLTEKDSDIALQKLAAYLTGVHGRSAQDILQQQYYRDFLQGKKSTNEAQNWTNYFNQYFRKL